MNIPRALILIVCAALLGACGETDAEAAKRAYEIASKNFLQPGAKCQAAAVVKDAYLRAGDAGEYQTWSAKEFNDCNAELLKY